MTTGTEVGNDLKKNGRTLKSPPPAGDADYGKAKAEEKGITINIPKLEVVRATIPVVGISPLIVHAWSEKAKKEMRDKQQKKAKSAKEAKDPQAEFNASRYIVSKGVDGVPVIAFKSAAVEAGVLAGIFKTTLRKAFFVGHTENGIMQDLVPIICEKGPEIREDMVRLQGTTADIRYRATYVDWSVNVPVEFNPRVISLEQLVNLFDNAGYSVGICEWRPERDGQFGRFRVKADQITTER